MVDTDGAACKRRGPGPFGAPGRILGLSICNNRLNEVGTVDVYVDLRSQVRCKYSYTQRGRPSRLYERPSEICLRGLRASESGDGRVDGRRGERESRISARGGVCSTSGRSVVRVGRTPLFLRI